MKHNPISPAAGSPLLTAPGEEAGPVARIVPAPASTLTWRGCGHPKTPENTRKAGDGEVRCRICRKVIDERSKQRKADCMSINGIGRPCNWDLLEVDPAYRPNMRAANHWRDKAEKACERHVSAMRREFMALAVKHRITVNDATLLLMNGVMP